MFTLSVVIVHGMLVKGPLSAVRRKTASSHRCFERNSHGALAVGAVHFAVRSRDDDT